MLIVPAMMAGLTDKLRDMENIAVMIDAANPSKKRGPYETAATAALLPITPQPCGDQ